MSDAMTIVQIFESMASWNTIEEIQTLVMTVFSKKIPITHVDDDSFSVQLDNSIQIRAFKNIYEIRICDYHRQTNDLIELDYTYKVHPDLILEDLESFLIEVDSDYSELKEFSNKLDSDLRKDYILDCSAFVNGAREITLLDKTYKIEIAKGRDCNEIHFTSPRTDEFKENVRQFKFEYKLNQTTIEFGKRSPRKLVWENAFSTHPVGVNPTYQELIQRMTAILTKFYDKKNLW